MKIVRRAVVVSAVALALGGYAQAASSGESLYKEKGCEICHGPAGRSIIPGFPSLDGQNADYLTAQSKDIRDGKRVNGNSLVMKSTMAGFNVSDEELKEISKYLSEQE